MEVIASEGRGDTRFLRWAVVLAVLAHVAIFVVHWPSFARASVEKEEPELIAYELQPIQYERPTPPPRRMIEVPNDGSIIVPGPPPEAPATLFRETRPAEFDFPVDLPFDPEGVEPPPAPEPQGPLVWDPLRMTAPVKVSAPIPVYPPLALEAAYESVVILECIIDTRGEVRVARVLRGGGLGLTEASVAAVEQWRFEPATLDGKPVDVIYVLTVRFNPRRV
jgi:TonB family protein